MKFNFKKVASIFASGVMLASTVGFAAAATFPAPFDSGSAIVYGASGNVQVDMAAAVNIQTAIGQLEDTPAGVPTGSFRVATSNDDLELNESISEVVTSIDKDDLPILASGEISTEKGTAVYDQFFYFESSKPGSNPASSAVGYQKNQDDIPGLYYMVESSEQIAEYRMEFTTYLESDVTSASVLEDIEDKEITMLGKTYVITNAVNTSTSVTDLTLMSGANKITISNGEELTVGGKTVSVLVTGTDEARFTVDGETTSKLADGGTAKLADGSYLGVSDITYQNFAGGLMQATVYLGADKIELRDGNSITVNGDSISYTAVAITESHSSGDISISQISINMTAEGDLYVGAGEKLSGNSELAEPEVLITQNWDIVYSGNEDVEYEEVSITKGSDSKMDLTFTDYNDKVVKFPLAFTNATGIYPGYKNGYGLVLDPAGNNISRRAYFILNTADPTTAANADNARSFVVQYLGSDDLDGSQEKAKFKVLGGDTMEVTLSSAGAATLKLGGSDFDFVNVSTCHASNCVLTLSTTQYNASDDNAHMNNGSISNYIRTKNNVLINITDLNSTFVGGYADATESAIRVIVTIDDTQKDGDKYTLTSQRSIFNASFTNTTDDEIASSYTGGLVSSWIADPEDSTHSTYIDNYGTEVDYSNPSGSPANVVLRVPESAVTPIVHITSGAVTAGTTATGGLAPVVADSAIDSVKDKNLVVVGGSCINSVAAKLLGSEVPLCGAAFTAKTNVGAGSYIIDTFASPYAAADSGKIAMLVAGYEAAETTSAAQRVVDDSLSLDASTAAIIGPATV